MTDVTRLTLAEARDALQDDRRADGLAFHPIAHAELKAHPRGHRLRRHDVADVLHDVAVETVGQPLSPHRFGRIDAVLEDVDADVLGRRRAGDQQQESGEKCPHVSVPPRA